MYKEINQICDTFLPPIIKGEKIYYIQFSDRSLIQFSEGRVLNKVDAIKFITIEEWSKYFIINGSLLIDTDFKNKEIANIFIKFNSKNKRVSKVLVIGDKKLLVKLIDEVQEVVNYGIFDVVTANIFYFKTELEIPNVIFNNKILCVDNSIIVSHDLSDGSELWRTDIEAITDFKNVRIQSEIIGEEDKIIFYASGEDKSATICLDAETGKLIAKYTDFGGHFKQFNNQIYNVRYPYKVHIIKPKSLETQAIDFTELLKPQKLEMWYDKFTVQDNDFYFVQNMGSSIARVGILDLNTKELKWLHTFEPKNGQVSDIQVHSVRLYVLTRDHTLHIFEREKQ